jgi:hypothetical protein
MMRTGCSSTSTALDTAADRRIEHSYPHVLKDRAHPWHQVNELVGKSIYTDSALPCLYALWEWLSSIPYCTPKARTIFSQQPMRWPCDTLAKLEQATV